MHEFVSFNNQISSHRQINLNALSTAGLYGKGIFTTIAVYGGIPHLWEKHWRRLTENAGRLFIDLSNFPEEKVKKSLVDLLNKNKTLNARARITFFDESSSEIWKTENERKTSLLITTADFRIVSQKISLTVSPYKINSHSPLVNIKSCNYLENILAFRAASEDGFDEAVRMNEKGEVVSGCLANIFWIKGKEIFTPGLETAALQGTTREFILENFIVHESKARIEEVKSAETVFLASAGIGVAEIGNLESLKYNSNEIFKYIQNWSDQFKLNYNKKSLSEF